MKTIIVPVDFSAVSENAALYAAKMAISIEAALLLVHMIPLPLSVSEVALTQYDYDALNETAETNMTALKDMLHEKTFGALHVTSTILLSNVEGALEALCAQKKPFAVIMGEERANSTERILIGNHTIEAARSLRSPVWVIPPGASFQPVSKLVLACDFKDIYALPKAEIGILLDAFHASLSIVHVCKNAKESKKSVAVASLTKYAMAEFKPHVYTIIHENIERGVEAFAEQHQMGPIIVVPKKKGMLDKLFRKSRSKPFMIHAHMPVIAIAG